jgi:uncharacterized protein (TIGR02646 family)
MTDKRSRIQTHYVVSDPSEEQKLQTLTQQAKTIGSDFWCNHSGFEDWIKSFKENVKGEYYTSQLRRCAYCSHELQQHKATYDLDHIIDKDTYSKFMFDTRNLANTCKLCNGTKSNKNVLTATGLGKVTQELPWESNDYSILHPHIDEWDAYLKYDEFKRIQSKDDNPKGNYTIEIVGIKKLNFMRISDHFGSKNGAAEKLLRKLNDRRLKKATKLNYIKLLEGLADELNSATAKRLVDVLKSEVT